MSERIIREVDHCNLNTDVPWLVGHIPTAENLAVAFWNACVPSCHRLASRPGLGNREELG